MSSEGPSLTTEQLEGAIGVLSHAAVFCFGVAVGVVLLGTAIQSAGGPFLVQASPIADALAEGEQWAAAGVLGCLVLFACAIAANRRLEALEEAETADTADSV